MNIRIKSLALLGSAFSLCVTDVLAQELYSTDFSTLDNWTVETGCTPGYSWASDATPSSRYCGAATFLSAPASLNFNNGEHIGGDGVHGGADVTCGSATSPPIDLGAAGIGATLSFWVSYDMESSCSWDELRLIVRPAGGGAAFFDECIVPVSIDCTWNEYTMPLDVQWGQVEVSFYFDTLDDWSNYGSGPFIDDLRVVSDGPCTPPVNYCTSTINSAGTMATISSTGSTSVTSNSLTLLADGCPPNKPGLFFYGPNQISAPLGDGLLCVGAGGLGHFRVKPPVITDASGSTSKALDLTVLPASAGIGQIDPGSTWNFQFWFRDPRGGSTGYSFSDGLEVTFCP